VLIRDVATSAARRYYASSGSQGGTKSNLKSQNSQHVAAISSRRSRIDNLSRKEDDSSDRSILEGQAGVGVAVSDLPVNHPAGQIVRTDEVAVEYHERRGAYEMQGMKKM
jgi:hypothetical protein